MRLMSTNAKKIRSKGNPIPVLYEDDAYIVFDKPSGLLVIPSPKKEQRTLVSIVNEQFSSVQLVGKLHPCHRLDKDTSGVIIFAKGKKNQQRMMEQFKYKRVKKKYLALVFGTLKNENGAIKGLVENLERKQFRGRSQAKYAETFYKVLEVRKYYSVVQVEPSTGRTNQIRIHFSGSGHPLVGDRKYSVTRRYPLKFKRTALHASSIQWQVSNDRKIKVISNLSKDMEVFIARN